MRVVVDTALGSVIDLLLDDTLDLVFVGVLVEVRLEGVVLALLLFEGLGDDLPLVLDRLEPVLHVKESEGLLEVLDLRAVVLWPIDLDDVVEDVFLKLVFILSLQLNSLHLTHNTSLTLLQVT